MGASVIGIDNGVTNSHNSFGDILDYPLIETLAKNVKGIVHLAAVSRVLWGEKSPQKCKLVNVSGTENVLKAAYHADSKPWVLYASSREVYGQQDDLPVSEEAPLKPCNHYARSKAAAEQLVNHYHSQGLTAAIMRFSNVYGSIDDHPDRVIPAFSKAAALGEPLYLEGEHNVFDFTAVDDVVRGIILNMQKLKQGQCLPPIHLTTGRGITLAQAADIAIAASQKQSEICYRAPRSYDVAKFIGATQTAKQLLGWEAKIQPEKGIPALVASFSNELVL